MVATLIFTESIYQTELADIVTDIAPPRKGDLVSIKHKIYTVENTIYDLTPTSINCIRVSLKLL